MKGCVSKKNNLRSSAVFCKQIFVKLFIWKTEIKFKMSSKRSNFVDISKKSASDVWKHFLKGITMCVETVNYEVVLTSLKTAFKI